MGDQEKKVSTIKAKDSKGFVFDKDANRIHRLMVGKKVVIVPQENLEEFYKLLENSETRR